MNKDFILNVDISTSQKFNTEEFESFRSYMENEFGFNEFSVILIENSEISPSGSVKIFIEDLEMEFDILEEIESLIPHLDSQLKEIEKESRIEWYSSRDLRNFIWEKTKHGWEESEESGGSDFYEDSFFDFDYD
jgi:hypothetical protein